MPIGRKKKSPNLGSQSLTAGSYRPSFYLSWGFRGAVTTRLYIQATDARDARRGRRRASPAAHLHAVACLPSTLASLEGSAGHVLSHVLWHPGSSACFAVVRARAF